MSDLIHSQQNGPVYEIVLNRPDKRNALNPEMMFGLEDAIRQAEAAAGVRAVVIRGEGRSFSAGIDLSSWAEVAALYGENWQQNLFPFTARYQHIMNSIERCSVPVIAALHGHCLGMAFELALACDLRIAAEGTRLGLPETRLGLVPDVGGTARLVRLVGPARAKELIMTGREFDTDYADRHGIVNAVVPVEELAAKIESVVEELVAAAPLAVSYAKRIINDMGDLDRALQLEAWAQSVLIRSKDFEVGAQAMLTRQKPEWQGR